MTNREYTHSALPWVALVINEPLKPYRTKRLAKKVKAATVHAQFYPPLKHDAHRADRPVPWVNLKGYWLTQAGFNIGVRYKITASNKKLILTVIDDE